MREVGVTCDLYLTQNDGTVISFEDATRHPVLTFASGPCNSMRGAVLLDGLNNGVVVDVGGTTTDAGVVHNRFPRPASAATYFAGVRTNFQMPETQSVGLGGGTIIELHEDGRFKIGPESVGYRLSTEALVYGGKTLTATDVAVALGHCDIGDRTLVAHLPRERLERIYESMIDMIVGVVDMCMTSKEESPVVTLVGGGSVLFAPGLQKAGRFTLHSPPHGEVANAVGSALSQISATHDRIIQLPPDQRSDILSKIEEDLKQELVGHGAAPDTLSIVSLDTVPLAYLPGCTMRVFMKAAGSLPMTSRIVSTGIVSRQSEQANALSGSAAAATTAAAAAAAAHFEPAALASGDTLAEATRVPVACGKTIEKTICPTTGEWLLTAYDIEAISIGAGILGCGGGGNPYLGKVRALSMLKEGKVARVIQPSQLPDDGRVVVIANVGAPTVAIEKLPSGTEGADAFAALKMLDPGSVCAITAAEVGGLNSIEPIIAAMNSNVPFVDADGMGRAFPEMQMYTPFIYGCAPHPVGLADEKGNTLIVQRVASAKTLETLVRTNVVALGCIAAVALAPLTKMEVMEKCVCGSLSLAWDLGRQIMVARANKDDVFEAIEKICGALKVFCGKIRDVQRTVTGGFARGSVVIEGDGPHKGSTARIAFQNELLTLVVDDGSGTERCVLTVPDLITIVDFHTGQPFVVEDFRYGLVVQVLAIPCHPLLKTEQALRVVGPRAFGLNNDYIPL
mmetsp:Transcript_38558/g.97069  ORF Transcript_38558/g.97069 Transcript_38558/m.97069 type:complete len:737 (-) Transcript_38558:8-2218(-)